MPLPVGHALAGVAIALVVTKKSTSKETWKFAGFCAFLSIFPDFDLGFVHILARVSYLAKSPSILVDVSMC